MALPPAARAGLLCHNALEVSSWEVHGHSLTSQLGAEQVDFHIFAAV
jgi:hypothetical protein